MQQNKHVNVFIPITEYHILLTLSIIEERYAGDDFDNVLIIGGRRLGGVNPEAFPKNVRVIYADFSNDKNIKQKVQKEVFSLDIKDLFVYHSFRYIETYILSMMKKGVRRHLVQDGTVFYTKLNRVMFFGLVKQTYKIYKELFQRGIFLKKLVFYRRYIQHHPLIDDIWLTNPEIYEEPKGVKKPLVKINIFPKSDSISRFNNYFLSDPNAPLVNRDKYLLFLPPHFKTDEQMLKCAEIIRKLLNQLKPEGLMIKIHPNSSKHQTEFLTKQFGDVVVKNSVPAELYFGNSTNSVIVAAASTSMLYNNLDCKYYALIGFFQQIGLYPDWKHVALAAHVKPINTELELNTITLS